MATRLMRAIVKIDEERCDGCGACVPSCAEGAIRVIDGKARLVADHLCDGLGNCLGTCPRGAITIEQRTAPSGPSRLGHWPVQLHLLPVESHLWQDADVLIAADCVGFAMPDFHSSLLAGKTLAVGCPKLDDVAGYADKLTQVFARNRVRSVTVAHMEVPCCTGIVAAVRQALAQAGCADLPLRDVTVGVDGSIQCVV
jgi:NAD-dependent dihydropyrimidine dehydrogenase PreA subunit